jgi:hypothetical protein
MLIAIADRRSRLSAGLVDALECLRSWSKIGDIEAGISYTGGKAEGIDRGREIGLILATSSIMISNKVI